MMNTFRDRNGSRDMFLGPDRMTGTIEISVGAKLDSLAEENSCAISLVDSSRYEIEIYNNNSICSELNPGAGFSPECDVYCGRSSSLAMAEGSAVSYRCHAGLDCRAVPIAIGDQPLVAIIGRTFTDAAKYREATERAISGDWNKYPPNSFFGNVLMGGSVRDLETTLDAVRKLFPARSPAAAILSEPDTQVQRHDEETTHGSLQPVETPSGRKTIHPGDETPASPSPVSELRSYIGSILKMDYSEASQKALDLVSKRYGFTSLMWLKRSGERLEPYSAYGAMKARRIRLSIPADNEQLIAALREGRSLEIKERRKAPPHDKTRSMSLFPIGVGAEVSSGIAIFDQIDSEAMTAEIARFCRAISQQFEILRLRTEIARGDSLSSALRRFGENLKSAHSDDLWFTVTRSAAELLKAERSSLLVFDEESRKFKVKAILGTGNAFIGEKAIGERIARHVYETRQPIAIADISEAGLPLDPDVRHYKTPSFLSSPITVGEKVVGVMNFADRACGETFDRASLELFDAIAPQIAMAIDRAELKERAGQFEQLSVTDALTGLLNRRYMEQRLMEETKRSNRHGYPMSFMMIDVDDFKGYNDNFGHPAGDEALKMVGNLIRETLRSADVAARFGGEEFAILLPQTTSREALTIADRIRATIEQTKFPHRQVTISIGVSSCSAELCRDADLVSAADQALYRAKRGGRNRVFEFENEIDHPDLKG